jgi:hypothetical protein
MGTGHAICNAHRSQTIVRLTQKIFGHLADPKDAQAFRMMKSALDESMLRRFILER